MRDGIYSFAMQCIGWSVEHLPVTHLEIVTLAYAATSVVIFIFWWNKPFNICHPVRVSRKSELGVTDSGIEAHDSEPREMQLQVREPISEQQKLTWKAIRNVLQTLFTFIIGAQDGDIILSCEDRVPRFGADNKHGDIFTAYIIMFGNWCDPLHRLFFFSIHVELSIWRISSAVITTVSIYMFLVLLLAAWLDNMDFNTASDIVLHLDLCLEVSRIL